MRLLATSRTMLVMLLSAALQACESSGLRTRNFPTDADGVRGASAVAGAQPAGPGDIFLKVVDEPAPPAPDPTVRWYEPYSAELTREAKVLNICRSAGEPDDCDLDDVLLGVIWVHEGGITHFGADGEGLAAAWDAQMRVDGRGNCCVLEGAVLVAAPWRRIGSEAARRLRLFRDPDSFEMIWLKAPVALVDATVACVPIGQINYACVDRADISAIAEGDPEEGRTVKIVAPGDDLRATAVSLGAQGDVFLQVPSPRRPEREHDVHVRAVTLVDDEQICGTLHDVSREVTREGCIPFSRVRRVYARDANRNLVEVSVDTALFPLKVVLVGIVTGVLTGAGAAQGR